MLKKAILIGGLVLTLLLAQQAQAYSIEQLNDTPVFKDFVIGPGKTEMQLDPGQSATRTLVVTNRYGTEMRFKFKVLDFTSSDKSNEVIRLLNDERGPYSLKDYLKSETDSIVLKHGERAKVQISVSIPKDAMPGGLYGAVVVTTEPPEGLGGDAAQVAGGITVETRVASLFFVRINGDVDESGSLVSFYSNAKFYQSGPVSLFYDYQNTGSIYNKPYGVIEVTNLYGTKVDEISINPYFVMPGSTRSEIKTLSRDFMIGRYKATIKLNRGYGDSVDIKSAVFWVLPWKVISGFFAGLLLIIVALNLLVRWFKKNFKYTGGKNDNPPTINTAQK